MGLPREDYVRFQQSSIELLSVVYDWDVGMAASARLKEYGPVAAPLGAVESIAATVPEDIRATGRLAIGVNVPHAPNEFKNSSGEIVGFDMDLMNAAAKTLGSVPDYRETAFESIMPSVQGGDFNVGMSSFIDTEERQEAVDFVTYFQAGGRCGRSGPGRR